MATISTQLRNFKEPTKEQLNLLYFALPIDVETHGGEKGAKGELERMEISAVLSLGVQGVEEAYVSDSEHRSGRPARPRRVTSVTDICERTSSRASCIYYRRTSRLRRSIANPCGSPYLCRQYGEWNG